MKGYTIQNSIDLLEKKGNSGGGGGETSAADVSYDNKSSHLTADDVQEAIDEINAKIVSTAAGISYDNTSSGLTADDVQEAIDELKRAIGATPVLPDTETLLYNDGTNDVYRKVVDCGALPNNTTKTVDPEISDLGDVKAVIPRIGYPSDSSYCEFAGSIGRFQARSTGISIITTADWSAYTCKLVLYYTKTPAQASTRKNQANRR